MLIKTSSRLLALNFFVGRAQGKGFKARLGDAEIMAVVDNALALANLLVVGWHAPLLFFFVVLSCGAWFCAENRTKTCF